MISLLADENLNGDIVRVQDVGLTRALSRNAFRLDLKRLL